MVAIPKLPPGEIAKTADQRVFLHGVPWAHYEILLAIRGERAVPRLSYLKGTLEIMGPSFGHERSKKLISRLIDAYADALGIHLNGYGSWTLTGAPEGVGAESDECYVRGRVPNPPVPDLAIEVIWTSGGIDKLEIYAPLGVREVWFWEAGAFRLFELRGKAYTEVKKSRVLPELDLALVARVLGEHTDQLDAVRALRKALAKKKPRKKRSK
jgi:Uma2 family endonuclease